MRASWYASWTRATWSAASLTCILTPEGKQVITGSCKRIAQRTGVDIPAEDVERILKSLYFGVERDGDALTVTVPDFRMDVDGEADLSEEVLRIYGYDKIPGTLLRGETTPGGRNDRMRLKDDLAEQLQGMGFYEIMNFSFVSPKDIEKLNLPAGRCAAQAPADSQSPGRGHVGDAFHAGARNAEDAGAEHEPRQRDGASVRGGGGL